MRTSRLALWAGASGLAAVLVAAPAQAATKAAAPSSSALSSQLQTLLLNQLDDLTRHTTPTDDSWYATDGWHAPHAVLDSPRAQLGVSVAAAVAAGRTTGPRSVQLRRMALRGVDAAVQQQLSNGAFSTSVAASSGDVNTMFVACSVAQAYVALQPILDGARLAAWRSSITRAADFLVHNGNLHWYTNGNINLGNAVVMAAAYRVSGDPVYASYMWTAVDYATNPDQSRWPGAGLVLTRAPARSDGSDGAGYFAEIGGGGTGYDPEYTMVQADLLGELYLMSGRAEVLRLMNLLVNQLLVRTDQTSWRLNTSGGTRHQATDWRFFTTPAVAVLAWRGGRSDLRNAATRQLLAVRANYTMRSQYEGPNAWVGLSSQVALPLQLLTGRTAPAFPARQPTSGG